MRRGAGAFNIFDVFVTGFDFAIENLGRRPPPLTALWREGSNYLLQHLMLRTQYDVDLGNEQRYGRI